jgi:hypothetical protein
MKAASDKSSVKTYVLVSTEAEREFLDAYFTRNSLEYTLTVYQPPYKGVCLPSYKLSSTLKADPEDIVVFGSDDFTPPENWDVYVVASLPQKGALMVNDGYQKLDFSNMEHPVFSIPIMTYSCLVDNNLVIYHPQYTHLYSDAELYKNLFEMGLVVDNREKDKDYIFVHHHWSNGRRQGDSNDQSYYNNMSRDKETWIRRSSMPLEERLKV